MNIADCVMLCLVKKTKKAFAEFLVAEEKEREAVTVNRLLREM